MFGREKGLGLFNCNRQVVLLLHCTATSISSVATAAPALSAAYSSTDAELDEDWAAQQQQDAEDAYFADA